MAAAPVGDDLLSRAHEIFQTLEERAAGESLGAQLVMMRETLDRLEGLWLSAGAEFSSSSGLAASGHRSLASWLRHHCRMSPSEAAARSGVAAEMADAERATGDAIVSGDITWRHAQVISRVLPQLPESRRVEAEQALLEKAKTLDPGRLRRVGDRLLHCFDRESAEHAAVRRYQRRGLSLAETYDGMVAVNGLLDPLTGATVMSALHTLTRPRPQVADHGDGHSAEAETAAAGGGGPREARTPAQRRADALGEVCAAWLALEGSGSAGTVGGSRPHVSVIVNHETLRAPHSRAGSRAGSRAVSPAGPDSEPPVEPGQLSWVGPITASETHLIGCDSVVSRVVMSGQSQVIDVGRATRTIPPALRRAVAARDRHCVGPGCDRLPELCDVHHVVFWENGGETSLANTVLLCRHHHQLVHLKHWRVTIDTTGRRTLSPPQ